MKTSVIGFPRIGTLRELKFASEKYFRKEISEEQLKEIKDYEKDIHTTARLPTLIIVCSLQ